MKKNWLIVSWEHVDHLDAPYGRLLCSVGGTREEAEEEARRYVPQFSPVGVVEEITV